MNVCAIEFDCRVGFFAQLTWCLEILAHCDENGTLPAFKMTQGYARPGENWFDYYFRLNTPVEVREYARAETIAWLRLPKDYNKTLNLPEATRLWNKYVSIRPEVMPDFSGEDWENMVGVHYRGSDKTSGQASEAPFISYQDFWIRVQRMLINIPHRPMRIYLSTDDPRFTKFAHTHRPSWISIWLDDQKSFSDGVNPSYLSNTNQDPRQKGLEALQIALRFSRCKVVYKTASILSAWPKIFNPDVEVVPITRPNEGYRWFPERDL